MDASATVSDVQNRARDFQDRIAPQIEEARRNLTVLNNSALNFIRERPGTCLLGAIAFGYLVGKIASRR